MNYLHNHFPAIVASKKCKDSLYRTHFLHSAVSSHGPLYIHVWMAKTRRYTLARCLLHAIISCMRRTVCSLGILAIVSDVLMFFRAHLQTLMQLCCKLFPLLLCVSSADTWSVCIALPNRGEIIIFYYLLCWLRSPPMQSDKVGARCKHAVSISAFKIHLLNPLFRSGFSPFGSCLSRFNFVFKCYRIV